MASSMKAVDALQEVQVLPRATASHQPGSKTRWREATDVRNRVEQVSRVGIEPRKVFASRGPARDNHLRMPDPWGWEARTVSRRWNAVSALSLTARPGRGHRGRRPDHADTGRARELVSASSASCLHIAEQCSAKCSAGSPPRDQSSPGKARGPAGSLSLLQNAGTTGTEGQAGTRRNSGGAGGSRSGA
jgi:hypothetical protein